MYVQGLTDAADAAADVSCDTAAAFWGGGMEGDAYPQCPPPPLIYWKARMGLRFRRNDQGNTQFFSVFIRYTNTRMTQYEYHKILF